MSEPVSLSPEPTSERLADLRADAIEIFHQALAGCNIDRAFERHLHFEGKRMLRQLSPVLPPLEQSLEGVKRVQVIAFGKAAVPMLDALLARLPEKLRVDGICSSPELPCKPHRHIRYYQGSHPLPNEDSVAAARAALDLLRKAGRETFVFFLISGGGSAVLELPRDPSIPLDDVRAFYETLVLCGAEIAEINTVRKHFSAVKGGRLAAAAPLAEKLTLLLADVPMKDIGVVASSPTLPDCSTWSDCAAVLERWQLLPRFPASVRAYFEKLAQAPAATKKPVGTPDNTQVDVLLSNHDFVNAARDHARSIGYKVVIDDAPDNWPYEQASAYLLEQMAALRQEHKRVCLLSSGEVTVTMPAGRKPGCGGRNQQFALESALRMDCGSQASADQMVVLSAGSDGIDGNSPAAGAVADPTTAARARAFQFDPAQALARYNTCPLFTALGDAIVTGPTGNNLRDLRILLAES
jgi:glycerate 2-kinase